MSGDRVDQGPTLATGLGWFAALLAFVVGARVIRDNSLLTHLATGELIIDTGSVPTVDPYSRTAPGESWTVQSWLASVLYAGVDRAAGPTGLRLLHGAVAAAVAGCLWHLTAPAKQVVTRLALTMIPIVIGAELWSPRPFMFGLLAAVVLLLIVETRLRPALMIPLFWMWANVHGSFPIGLAMLAALAVGRFLDLRIERREHEVAGLGAVGRQTGGFDARTPFDAARYVAGRVPLKTRWVNAPVEVRHTAAALVGVLLAAVNPIGPRLLWFPLHLLGRREALSGVVEWQPPSFDSVADLLFLGLIPLVAVAARFGAPWRSLLPSLCFLAAGFLAIRNIAMASIVVVVVVAPSFRDRVGAEDGLFSGLVPRLLTRGAALGIAAVAVVVASGPGFDLDAYPVDEVALLEQRGLTPGADTGLVHREAVGNYLAYRYGPDAGVFIDDRFDYYPVELTDDHLALLEGGDYRAVLDRWGGDVVLWEDETLLADWLALAEGWTVVHDRDGWVIACRIDSPAHERCIGD
ncbi:MAG: hypothetical protein AAF547_16875 [Actinomycetota bacterium]